MNQQQSDDESIAIMPVARRKLSDDVSDQLRDMITSGVLAAGDVMPSERELMARFGVGRPAIREALQSLEAKGLVTISHGERTRVNALSASAIFAQVDDVARMMLSSEPANLSHLKQVRQIIEAGIVRIAASRCTPDDARDLAEKVREQGRQRTDAQAFIQADIAFHSRIAQITANPLIIAISEAMLKWLSQYHTSLLSWSGHEQTTLDEHERIVQLLADNDVDRSVRMMEMHLARSENLYLSTMSNE